MIAIDELKDKALEFIAALDKFKNDFEVLDNNIKELNEEIPEGEYDEELYQYLMLYVEYNKVWGKLDDLVEYDIVTTIDLIEELGNTKIKLN